MVTTNIPETMSEQRIYDLGAGRAGTAFAHRPGG